ncbi:zinc finger protein 93-like isoform X2 [Plodia interpunctella]|uniref:zinc finger protein 93-like isoform X2 n=1 Tax=Plodia interpunctella TaxID=58824 RepID=UPI00236898B2|nr:zinc finger protein 93-like isoform X2 [Plodia interpunctella]
MDIENLRSWIGQPDVCRCCLSACGLWDMTVPYITEAGKKEVFGDMLQQCFGISLTHITKWGPSRMVCSLCVGHLREAHNFREQVLQANKHFNEHWSSKSEEDKDMDIKMETELEDTHSANCLDDISYSENYSTVKLDITDETVQPISNSEKKRKRQNTNNKGVRKKRIKSDEYDSDAPISLLVKKVHDVDEEERVVQDQLVPANCIKHVSERKRVMLTCCIVLTETTACPFRHHKSWFQCFFCHQDFMEINLLRKHTSQVHHDINGELKKIKRFPRSLQIEISNLECRLCNLNLMDVESMRRHLVDVHNKIIYKECIADYKVNTSPYSCHICKREFHVFRTLTTHLNEHYANCICDICGKSFLNSKRLKVHKRTHENGNFPCNECGKVLKTKTSKANHMESAHSKRQLKCQICFKPMKHYNDRIKHMSEVHNITHKFVCPICSREYNIKHYLATHMRQTHGHKNKKCGDCGMAFITNHGLKKHMLKHSGEKPFTCNICSKAYARSYTLREHMRCHGCPQ